MPCTKNKFLSVCAPSARQNTGTAAIQSRELIDSVFPISLTPCRHQLLRDSKFYIIYK